MLPNQMLQQQKQHTAAAVALNLSSVLLFFLVAERRLLWNQFQFQSKPVNHLLLSVFTVISYQFDIALKIIV